MTRWFRWPTASAGATEHRAELHVIDGDHRLTDRVFEINRLFDWLLHDLQHED